GGHIGVAAMLPRWRRRRLMPTNPVSKSFIGAVAFLAFTAVLFIAIPQTRAIALSIAEHHGFFHQDKRPHDLSKREASGRLAVGVIGRAKHKGIAAWDGYFSPRNRGHLHLGDLSSYWSEFGWLGSEVAAGDANPSVTGPVGEPALEASDELLDT